MSLLRFLKFSSEDIASAKGAYVRQICALSDPLAIYLFGSMARGEASIESDIDLLVIYRNSVEAKKAEKAILRSKAPFPIASDILFIDLEKWQGKNGYSPLVGQVKDEGVRIYHSNDWNLENEIKE